MMMLVVLKSYSPGSVRFVALLEDLQPIWMRLIREALGRFMAAHSEIKEPKLTLQRNTT